jgi:hypothetical protein
MLSVKGGGGIDGAGAFPFLSSASFCGVLHFHLGNISRDIPIGILI